MQRKFEAPRNCPKGNGFPCNNQYYGSPTEGVFGLKDGIGNCSDGNAKDSCCPQGGEPAVTLSEFHGKPLHRYEYSAFHLSCQKVEQAQANAMENQLYPFRVETGFHHVPFYIYTQAGFPYYYHFQDFHYFVVIDFEATCDKGKNPHPQEIIEFPSVIVSSVTGQLEACFQTYVRPTCNQVLSEFCKDLTGIQQIQVRH